MIPQKNPLIASGESVHANMFFKLWENPNPSAAFASQNIDLSSDDYDFLLVEWAYGTGTPLKHVPSVIVPKGQSVQLNETTSTSNGVGAIYRNITYVNDTRLQVADCYLKDMSNAAVAYNTLAIPVFVYGFKKSLDITAIVSNVSTDATKCILSDNVTNVDDAIDGMTWKYLDSTTGNAEIAIPANATEVYVRSSNSSTSCSFHFLTVENDISVDRAAGYYGGSASNYFYASFQWIKSTRKAKLYSFVFAGTDYTNSTTTKWYYKTK